MSIQIRTLMALHAPQFDGLNNHRVYIMNNEPLEEYILLRAITHDDLVIWLICQLMKPILGQKLRLHFFPQVKDKKQGGEE